MDNKTIKAFALALICTCLLTACTNLRHGKQMQIDGERISYAAIGEGPVTIVLESGLGDGMESWDGIMDEVSKISRVFAYSRPGYLPSSRTERPRTPRQIVDDLRRLLRQTGHNPPYLLVGHSLGGLYVLNFVERYPEEVAGVVLVDGRHPMTTKACEQRQLSGCSMPHLLQLTLPGQALAEYRAAQAARMPATMGDKPLAVVSRAPQRGMKSEQWRTLWSEMQLDLAELSRRSRHLVAEHGGHYVHREEPGRVIDGISWVLSSWLDEVSGVAYPSISSQLKSGSLLPPIKIY
ncbi:MAG: alpha/beta hydrolase [Candidatus Thiodiazotropha sp.]